MPSHQTCHHSPRLRRYSVGCTTNGAGKRTARVAAVERTATSGCNALSVCSELNGIVGTSSACTESAVTICGNDADFPLIGETVMVGSLSSEAELLLCICTLPHAESVL